MPGKRKPRTRRASWSREYYIYHWLINNNYYEISFYNQYIILRDFHLESCLYLQLKPIYLASIYRGLLHSKTLS